MVTRVVAVDVGSVGPPSRFAWAAFDVPEMDPVAEGDDPQSVVEAVAACLGQAGRVALLMESPLAVPVPGAGGWRSLGKARNGEGNRPWSAGAGAGVLATGVAQAAWILSELARRTGNLVTTTQAGTWLRGPARLFLAEAFVSWTGKPVPVPAGQHAADAAAAGKEFVGRLRDETVVSDVSCTPHAPFNLLAAAAMWAGLSVDGDELRKDVVVVKVRPVPRT